MGDAVQMDDACQRPGLLDMLRILSCRLLRAGRLCVRFVADRGSLRINAIGAAPKDGQLASVCAHDQIGAAVAVQVAGRQLLRGDIQIDESVRLKTQLGLIEDAQRALADKRQIGTAVTVKICSRHRCTLWDRQLLLAALAHPIGRAIVDGRIEVGPDPVVPHPQNQVVIAVAVEVSDRSRPRALRRQLREAGVAQGVIVHVGRRALAMILAIAEEQVQVAVAVEIVLVDALQHARAGYVQVLPCVTANTLSKALESARSPGSSHLLRL